MIKVIISALPVVVVVSILSAERRLKNRLKEVKTSQVRYFKEEIFSIRQDTRANRTRNTTRSIKHTTSA